MSPHTNAPVGDKLKPESAARVQKHREALRARGLRSITRWVPDTRKPEFVQQYRAQLAALASSPEGRAFWNWMDQVRSTEGWV